MRRATQILNSTTPQRPLDRLFRWLINRALRQRSLRRLPTILLNVGLDGPSFQIDDCDAKEYRLQPLRIREHCHCRFRRVVRGLEWQRNSRCTGRLVRNHPLGLEQQRQKGLRDSEVRSHVEIEQFLGLKNGDVGDGHAVHGAGIVNQDVEVPTQAAIEESNWTSNVSVSMPRDAICAILEGFRAVA